MPMIRSITETPVLPRPGRMSPGSFSSLTYSRTVVMAPGPANMGIARGKIETSSRASALSSPEVFVLPGFPSRSPWTR